MRVLNNFTCTDCGDTHERFVEGSLQVVECHCGGKSVRVINTPTIKLDGISGDFPSAHDHWANVREQRARIHQKKSYFAG